MSRVIPIFKDQKEYLEYFFNSDGSEKLDLTPPRMPLEGFETTSSVDAKLKLMLDKMMEKQNPQFETRDDDLDFDVPSDIPENRFADFLTKEEVNEFKEFQKKLKKQAAAKDRAARKAAQTARAKPVVNNNNTTSSASESSDEVADDE